VAATTCPVNGGKSVAKRQATQIAIRTQGQVGYRRRDYGYGYGVKNLWRKVARIPHPVGTHGCALPQRAVFNREKYSTRDFFEYSPLLKKEMSIPYFY
jgi:hypothetical protein